MTEAFVFWVVRPIAEVVGVLLLLVLVSLILYAMVAARSIIDKMKGK